MRLFIAIPLSDRIKAMLQEVQQSLPEGIRRQPEDQMHLTLRFLGETSPNRTKKIKDKLGKIELPAFALPIKGAGTFPPHKKYRIIWAGVQPVKPLMNLQKKVEEACTESGLEPEDRTYIPHITLGKVKKTSSNEVKKWVKTNGKGIKFETKASRFIIYESTFTGHSVKHNPKEKYCLNY
ncbi:MAG TPA: RNA 2',3'-cyclic phosphodiesterase [Balneolaceae bacterium]|nr:RNA 2',3'-cyclic phosphodiesterase [Balneolaceae bacterium]